MTNIAHVTANIAQFLATIKCETANKASEVAKMASLKPMGVQTLKWKIPLFKPFPEYKILSS